jgi:hypothetical protein
MRRVILLTLLAMGLPTAALANSIDFLNSGGTLSGSSAGLTLSGSTLIGVGSIMGNDLGTVTFSTGALATGNLQMGGTFMAGGTFTITGNGANGVHDGVIFSGSFTGPVTWTLVTTNGNSYQLSGTVSGTWFTGATLNGTTVAETVNLGSTFFVTSATLGKGHTNIVTSVVPEPGALTLLGTGLIGLTAMVRRKLQLPT